jgi:hypothetical protein
MILALLFAVALPQGQSAPPVAEGDEIVVRATRRKCAIEIAHRTVSDAEFKARAADWAAGRPVRVIVPAGTGYKCLARIMFRLNDHGVVRAVFVDAPAQ